MHGDCGAGVILIATSGGGTELARTTDATADFLQLSLRGQSRDYLGVMLDQAAVEVDPPSLLSHQDARLVAKSERVLGGSLADRAAGANHGAGLTFILRQNANGDLPA